MITSYNKLTGRTHIKRGDKTRIEYIPFSTKYYIQHPIRFKLSRPIVDLLIKINNIVFKHVG